MDFNFNAEVGKTLIAYVLPLVLGGAITYFASLADFIWRDILRSWRGFVVTGALLLSYLLLPAYSVWITVVLLTLLSVNRLEAYRTGPTLELFAVLFTGFYRISNKHGRLVRSGQAKLLDTKFLVTLNTLISEHEIQRHFPIRVQRFLPPPFIYSRDDYEAFARRMRKYAADTTGVVWGIVDDSGQVTNFEITVNEENFQSAKFTQRFTRDITQVFEVTGVSTNAGLEFTATVYAALVGHAFCDALNRGGKWSTSLRLAAQSRRLAEHAIEEIRTKTSGGDIETFVALQRRRLLPMFLRQEAIALRFNQNENALRKLVEAITIDPFFPFHDTSEFTHFYNQKYTWELMGISGDPKADVYGEQAFELTLPNLQLLMNWMYLGATNGWVRDLESKIEDWFATLSIRCPHNPFIYLYWAEALKIAGLKSDTEEGSHRIFTRVPDLPLDILNQMIEKLEEAHRIDPHLGITSWRLAALYGMSALLCETDKAEYDKRMKLAVDYQRLGMAYAAEYLTDTTPRDPKDTSWTSEFSDKSRDIIEQLRRDV